MQTFSWRPFLLVWLVLSSQAYSVEMVLKSKSCGFGLFAWCLWDAPPSAAQPSLWRTEIFSGYKPGMRYYEKETAACSQAGDCELDAQGFVLGADVYRNVSGNTRSSDYTDIGLQYSQMPVAAWKSASPFDGSLDNAIDPGRGSLRYHFVRLAVKRSHFLYFLHSKYLISSFGVGVGIPETTGVGKEFVGASQLVPSIGGKLGFQYPIHESLDIGLASNWNVLWYGSSMADAAFLGGYGLNLSARI